MQDNSWSKWKCKGPNYTFFVPGVGRSYIDHCIVWDDLYDKIETCTVIEDSICNTSDHLAMVIKKHITLTKAENNQIPVRIAWHKLSDEEISQLYIIPVQRNIIEIMAAFNVDYDQTSSDLIHIKLLN